MSPREIPCKTPHFHSIQAIISIGLYEVCVLRAPFVTLEFDKRNDYLDGYYLHEKLEFAVNFRNYCSKFNEWENLIVAVAAIDLRGLEVNISVISFQESFQVVFSARNDFSFHFFASVSISMK